MAKKKKPTKKLGVQELEKRKAPFASPITYREEGAEGGGGGIESTGPVRSEDPDVNRPAGPIRKTPIVHRTE